MNASILFFSTYSNFFFSIQIPKRYVFYFNNVKRIILRKRISRQAYLLQSSPLPPIR